MKRILATLCALAIVMAGSVSALAAEKDIGTDQDASHYPISVEEYTYGEAEEPRISKVHQLSLSDAPSGIPTEDFVRSGRLYSPLDMFRKNKVGVDTKLHMGTVPPYLPRNRTHIPSRRPGELSVARTFHIIFPYTTAFFYAKMVAVHIVPSWCFGCVVTPFYHWGLYELFYFPMVSLLTV